MIKVKKNRRIKTTLKLSKNNSCEKGATLVKCYTDYTLETVTNNLMKKGDYKMLIKQNFILNS